MNETQVKNFISRFEAGLVSKCEWTHEAHLLVGLWYVSNYDFEEVTALVRKFITAHNATVGTPNTDQEGYHETITRFWLEVSREFIAQHREFDLPTIFEKFLGSDESKSSYPLAFYSKELLFSVEARKKFIAADLKTFNEHRSHE